MHEKRCTKKSFDTQWIYMSNTLQISTYPLFKLLIKQEICDLQLHKKIYNQIMLHINITTFP